MSKQTNKIYSVWNDIDNKCWNLAENSTLSFNQICRDSWANIGNVKFGIRDYWRTRD